MPTWLPFVRKRVGPDIVVALFTFAVRLGAWALLPHLEMNSDFFRYQADAANLLAGHGYKLAPGGPPDIVDTPGYPALILLVRLAWGDSLNALRFIQIAVSALTAVIVQKLGGRLFSAKAGWIAALLFAMYPPFIVLPLQGYSELPYLFVLMLFVLVYMRFLESPGFRNGVLSGATLGIATLTRPVSVLLPFALFLGLALAKPQRARSHLNGFAILLISFTAVLTPWIIRTSVAAGHFVLLDARSGELFYRGTFPDQVEFDAERRLALADRHLDELPGGDPAPPEMDRVYYTAGLRRISQAPGRYLLLLLPKFAAYWYLTDTMGDGARWLALFQSLVVAPAFWAIWLLRRRARQTMLLSVLLIIGYFVAVNVFLYPLARFSLPIIPLLMVLLAGAASETIGRAYGEFKAQPALREPLS